MTWTAQFAKDESIQTTIKQKGAAHEIIYKQILKFGQGDYFRIWSYRFQRIGSPIDVNQSGDDFLQSQRDP